MSSSPSLASKRVRTELSQLASSSSSSTSPTPFLSHLGPIADDDILHWTAIMQGPQGGAYQQGRWKLDVRIPDSYPMKPPECRFLTRICHPNVDFNTGEICLDLLKDAWAPNNTIVSTLSAIHHLLAYPEPESPLNVDVSVLMRNGDHVGTESLIRWCCSEWRSEEVL